jgi:hypothetical protein
LIDKFFAYVTPMSVSTYQHGDYEGQHFWDVAPCSLVNFTDVSEERTASIFAEQTADNHVINKRSVYISSLLASNSILILLLYLEGGSRRVLRNKEEILPNYMASHLMIELFT